MLLRHTKHLTKGYHSLGHPHLPDQVAPKLLQPAQMTGEIFFTLNFISSLEGD